MKVRIVKFIYRMIGKFFWCLGYELRKRPKLALGSDTECAYNTGARSVTDLERLSAESRQIPGMIEPESGKMLYALAYMQALYGDVVEIGAWQGRSTLFLAKAVVDSGNGQFFAIDHFRGNAGKERHYRINGSLEGLKERFLENVKTAGLAGVVNLLDMDTAQASTELGQKSIRFLFVDGDHSYNGVRKDIEVFLPKLAPGAIIVFDDYFEHFSGLLNAVDEYLFGVELEKKAFYYRHTLVVEIR